MKRSVNSLCSTAIARDANHHSTAHSTHSPRVVLVDPIRTSRALIEELDRRKLPLRLVQSNLVGDLPDDAHHDIVRESSLEKTARNLQQWGATHIVGCVDPSVNYADHLRSMLDLPGNGMAQSDARRNKIAMVRAIQNAGLRIPLSFETRNRQHFEQYLLHCTFPVVVKPVASGGTDNVHFCEDQKAALYAFDQIYLRPNLHHGVNTAALVQEYIDGTEYVVDCVSFEGNHCTVDMFAYQKNTHNGRAFIYEKETILHHGDPLCTKLEQVAYQALDALDFQLGPSHMELKVNGRGEVVFIEVGPRLNGGDIYKLVQDTREDGKSQVELSIDCLSGISRPSSNYRLKKEGVRVHLVIRGQGIFRGIRRLEAIQALPSFTRLDLHIELGQQLQPTKDLSDLAGWIDLTHEDVTILRHDEQCLDGWIAGGILDLE